MANNFSGKDADGNVVTFESEDVGGGVQRPRRRISKIDDGASADLGTKSDAKVVTDADGSVIAFLRGLVYLISNRVAALGQAVMAASAPVVIASDQSAIPVAGTMLNGGPAWTQDIVPTTSANMTSLTDISNAPNAGEHTVLESLTVSSAVETVLTIQEETTHLVIKVFNLTTGNLSQEWNPTNGVRLPQINKKLQAIAADAGQIDITAITHSAA